MVAMSNDGYRAHKDTMAEECIIVYEKDLVKPEAKGPKVKTYGIPATRFAEELGRKIVLNIVMLGFFGAVTDLLPREALRKAVESSVPSGTEELNLKAFDKGYEYGVELKEKAEVAV
jgi:2-oxoglutarate ferredoxin oxidoreductase subunit gamma